MNRTLIRSFRDEYLQTLPPWDGVDRIDTLLQTVLDVALPDDDARAITTLAARVILLGAVERALSPSAPLGGWTPVLYGEPNTGKSAFCSALLPTDSGWLWNGLSLRDLEQPLQGERANELVAPLRGRAIVECVGERIEELPENVEAWLKRATDPSLWLHDHRHETSGLTHVTVVTANVSPVWLGFTHDFLCTRVLPVKVTGRNVSDPESVLGEIRDQVWAEAWERVTGQGESVGTILLASPDPVTHGVTPEMLERRFWTDWCDEDPTSCAQGSGL